MRHTLVVKSCWVFRAFPYADVIKTYPIAGNNKIRKIYVLKFSCDSLRLSLLTGKFFLVEEMT